MVENFLIWPFNNRNGILHIYDINIKEITNNYGTPLLITSEEILERNYKTIHDSFSKLYKNFVINYAVKANSNPSILSIFRKLGSGVDVASLGEIFIAKYSGFDNNKIMFTPNFQSRNDLLKALMSGIKINFDDISQYESIKDFRPEFVSFRINPGIGGGEFKGIITGGHETKFGIPEELAEKAYELALKNGAKKFGIHMHGGSNNLDKEYFKKITDRFFKIVYRIQKNLNIKFDIIDIGGGFGVPYRDEEIPLDMDSVANFVIENFKNYNLDKEKEPVLVIEPGRYLVANSTILIGTITGIKNYDKKIVGTDVGMNILIRPALYGAYHKILIANNLNQMNKENVDIVGQICENTDKIASNRPMPEVNINDKIVIFNAGAYVYSMSSNYNGMLRPMELLIDKNKQIHIIRERENFNDLIKNVRIPDYLMF